MADSVEKVPSGGAAKIGLNRTEIYNRLSDDEQKAIAANQLPAAVGHRLSV
jgi:hypothetical protein